MIRSHCFWECPFNLVFQYNHLPDKLSAEDRSLPYREWSQKRLTAKGRHQSLTEIRYLYSVKIEGEGVRKKKWLCKDTVLGIRQKFICKDRGGGGPRSYLYTVKIANFCQTLMWSLRDSGRSLPRITRTRLRVNWNSRSPSEFLSQPLSPQVTLPAEVAFNQLRALVALGETQKQCQSTSASATLKMRDVTNSVCSPFLWRPFSVSCFTLYQLFISIILAVSFQWSYLQCWSKVSHISIGFFFHPCTIFKVNLSKDYKEYTSQHGQMDLAH